MNNDKIDNDNAYVLQIILQKLSDKYLLEENRVKASMKESRYSHTRGVIELSVELAIKYGESPEEAYVAALFHDYSKYITVEEAKTYLKDMDILKKVKDGEDLRLYHGMIAAYVLDSNYSQQMIRQLGSRASFDRVLDAMRYHTFGRKKMSMLDKIIYVADAAEKGRSYEGVEDIRAMMFEDINKSLLYSVNGTIKHVVESGANLRTDSVKMRNQLLIEIGT